MYTVVSSIVIVIVIVVVIIIIRFRVYRYLIYTLSLFL